MNYRVMLWQRSTSRQADVERVVARVSGVDDAIRSLMQNLDCGYASMALAYPIDRDIKDISPEHWRRRVRCRVSGDFSSIKDNSWQGPLSA